jgi:hypothetical protein
MVTGSSPEQEFSRSGVNVKTATREDTAARRDIVTSSFFRCLGRG